MTKISLDALHSDETRLYHCPLEPKAGDIVKVRFRTAKDDVDEVLLVCRNQKFILEKETSTEVFDYYMTEIVAEDEIIRYYFEVHKGEEVVIYNRRGVFNDTREQYQFSIVPGFETPNWAKGAVMYQIYTDRFCNGDTTNDVVNDEYFYINDTVKKVDNWDEIPATLDVGRFYGGDLKGVWDKLDYLQNLGIEVLYFNPLFVSPSNHKYDCQDYEHIDPHLTVIAHDGGDVLSGGCHDNMKATKYIERTANLENLEASNEFFAKFCEELHKRGMKIIIDGVFNHSGSFNKWMDRERIYEGREGFEKGAFVDKESPYHSFYQFNEDSWPYNKNYDGWWANDTLPKLNYEASPMLEDYIIEIGKKWVSPPYNVDGWRLDVADELPDVFVDKIRCAIKTENPEALLMGEVWEDASNKISHGYRRRFLQGKQLDSVMNYPFRSAIIDYVMGGDAYKLNNVVCDILCNYPKQVVDVMMNHLGTHDTERILSVLGGADLSLNRAQQAGVKLNDEQVQVALKRLKLATVLQYTLPGIPSLYYGDEAQTEGLRDPFNRTAFPWGRENKNLVEFFKNLGKLRLQNDAFCGGQYECINAGLGTICYIRKKGKNEVLIAVNRWTQNDEIIIPEGFNKVYMGQQPNGNKLILSPMSATVLIKE